MDTNVSLNYWLKKHPHHHMNVQWDDFMQKFIAIVVGAGSPPFVGYGYSVAEAVQGMNKEVAGAAERGIYK
jgi:hypothetical protein